ncbi:MAG: hypothetical protein ACYTBJ_07550 [Planctomycetota bacterium]|jgi:hypothetical protein
MRTQRILEVIIFLVLGLISCVARVGEAAPMGSAFTYQGRLMDSNYPANDLYEFQFRLYDSPEDGNQLGPNIALRGIEVDDGYFTVALDFGALVYNGDARWLEIHTKPPGTPDPFVTLSPRQELTPTPYARYAAVAGSTVGGIEGNGSTDYLAKFTSPSTVGDSMIYQLDNKVGIGTQGPQGRVSIQMPSAASPIDVDGLVIRNGLWNNGDHLEVQDFSGNTKLVIRGGRIGIGTTSPDVGLHLKGAGWPASFVHLEGDPGYGAGIRLYEGDTAKWHIFNSTDDSGLRIYNSDGSKTVFFAEQGLGEVGINTTSPTAMLDVWSRGTDRDVIKAHASDGSELFKVRESSLGNGDIFLRDSDGTTKVLLSTYGPTLLNGGNVGIGVFPTSKLEVDGRTKTSELEITGGSDLSEHFDIDDSREQIEPGMVVCIHPESPGKLDLSRKAYDRKVAGIVSGAGGVRTGLLMGQKDSVANGAYPVALTGRVYCRADASSGSIRPGDLLTTSHTPGHAMKVSNYELGQGAILGKAMSTLEEGQGLVLVLVALQ